MRLPAAAMSAHEPASTSEGSGVGRRVLDLEALLRVPYVEPDSGVTLSSDGAQVAFSWIRSGQWQICILPLDRSAPPYLTTTGPGAKIAPSSFFWTASPLRCN